MQNTEIPPTPRFFRIAQIIGIIGVSLLLINFFYQVWRLHTKDDQKQRSNFCDFQQGDCIKQVGDATLTLSLNPLPPTASVNTEITIVLNRIHVEQVGILLLPYPHGDSKAQPILLKTTSKNIYSNSITIPKTKSGKQRWVVMVMLKQGTKQTSVPFEFDVNN